jgi:hypothetical protein
MMKYSIYPNLDREKLYERMKHEFYKDAEIVAYASNGAELTREQYRERVKVGIEECAKGESISLEDLSKELGYPSADGCRLIRCCFLIRQSWTFKIVFPICKIPKVQQQQSVLNAAFFQK